MFIQTNGKLIKNVGDKLETVKIIKLQALTSATYHCTSVHNQWQKLRANVQFTNLQNHCISLVLVLTSTQFVIYADSDTGAAE